VRLQHAYKYDNLVDTELIRAKTCRISRYVNLPVIPTLLGYVMYKEWFMAGHLRTRAYAKLQYFGPVIALSGVYMCSGSGVRTYLTSHHTSCYFNHTALLQLLNSEAFRVIG
jgi:hypothetical protein